VIDFAIDPEAIYGIITPWADTIIFNLPVLLWLDIGFMVLLYWAELVKSTGIQQIQNISKLRPFLIAFVIITAVVIFPASIWLALVPSFASNGTYNGLLIVAFLLFIALSLIYGTKLLRIVKSSWNSGKSEVFKVFLKKLTVFLFMLNAVTISFIIVLVIFTIINADAKPWPYIILHWILRTLEVAAVVTMLVMFSKKETKIRQDKEQEFFIQGRRFHSDGLEKYACVILNDGINYS